MRGADAGRAIVMRRLRRGAPANHHRLPALCRTAGRDEFRGVRCLPTTPVAFRRHPGVVPLPTPGRSPDSESEVPPTTFTRARAGGLLAEHLQAGAAPRPDILVPVPLHRTRLRERGYNQSLELARGGAAFRPTASNARRKARTRHLATNDPDFKRTASQRAQRFSYHSGFFRETCCHRRRRHDQRPYRQRTRQMPAPRRCGWCRGVGNGESLADIGYDPASGITCSLLPPNGSGSTAIAVCRGCRW